MSFQLRSHILIFCWAKNNSCLWSRSRDIVTYIVCTLESFLSHLRPDSQLDSFHSLTLALLQTFHHVQIETTTNMGERTTGGDTLIAITKWVYVSHSHILNCLVGWGYRIHRLNLCQGVTPYECPGYDTKQSDGEVPVMLELWGMQSALSLPSLLGPLWPEVVEPDKCPIYGLDRFKPWFLEFTVFLHLNCVFMQHWIV